MTLPPQGSPHYELRRRIAGCRERLRKARNTQRDTGRLAHKQANETGGDPAADDEEDGQPSRKVKSPRR